MDDRELANKVVALGIGKANQIYPDAIGRFYQIDLDADWQTSVSDAKFVSDWRVAGALMERCVTGDRDDFRTVACSYHPTIDIFEASMALSATPTYGTYLDRQGDTMPRAIIEACVAALDESRG